MVLGKAVRIEWRKQDRYGRIVGKLILLDPPCATCPQTLDAGLAQLEADYHQRPHSALQNQSPAQVVRC